MILDLYTALAIGTACVLVCSSDVMLWLREWIGSLGHWPDKLINCTFCTSVWLSVAASLYYPGGAGLLGYFIRAGAIAAVANFTVLLIHASIATVGVDDECVQDS